jgi:precorrin-3B C17-methyltransferase
MKRLSWSVKDADQHGAAAACAGPEGRIELNSFQQLILHTHLDLEVVQQALAQLGVGIYKVGAVVKNIHTCTFCMGERIEGLPDAQALDRVVAGTAVPFTVRIGFSGCQANCGEALIRDIGIVRMSTGLYDIYIGGRPGSLQPVFGQRAAEGLPGQQLPRALTALLTCYRDNARGKERFWKAVQRLTVAPFQSAMISGE